VKQAHFRFYAELNDFLPPEERATAFPCVFEGKPSVKHLIEALGVPHTEVDLVLINGCSASFSEHVEDGDRVSVYPVFESFDIATASRVRPHPLRQTRFVADAHLGKLAAYLRMLGFDTLYRNDFGDDELVEIASSEHRILLTRDRELLKRSAVTHGYLVRETGCRNQLLEVLRRFDLGGCAAPFTRCMRCNGELEETPKEEVSNEVPPLSREHCDEFRRCRDCRQVYWNGSHQRRMAQFISQVEQEVSHGLL
jgi:uncharacterized protein with PIN domain